MPISKELGSNLDQVALQVSAYEEYLCRVPGATEVDLRISTLGDDDVGYYLQFADEQLLISKYDRARDEELERRPIMDYPVAIRLKGCLLYTSPSPRDATLSRMPSSA